LNYSLFREHPSAAVSAKGQSPEEDACPALNAWQVRHAMLVVRVVKEVNELRYVLCPRYLTDQQFWEIYFSLAQPHLPGRAFLWRQGDPLPPVSVIKDGDDAFMSLTGIGNQLRNLGTKIHAAAHAGAESAGVELSTFFPTKEASRAQVDVAANSNKEASVSTDGPAGQSGKLLEIDPDLEEYLRGTASGSECEEEVESPEVGDSGDKPRVGDDQGDELDLDQYLNELSDVVDDVEGLGNDDDGAGGVDVEAVLRELEEEASAEK